MDLSNFGIKDDIDPNTINNFYTQGQNIDSLKSRYNNKYKQTSIKIKDQLLIINTILSDEGIINLLNSYFCDGKILSKQFCYQYLNNIVNNLNIISDWQVLDKIYRDFYNKINDHKVDIPNNTDLDTGLAANYVNNSNNYNKIVGTNIIVDFNRDGMSLANPKDYKIEGTIVKYNQTFWFFLINSFQVDFKNLTSKQRVIIDNQIERDNFVCWKNYEGPNMYNIVLWNGANNGLKFKFTKDITQLGLSSKKMTENIDSDKIDNKLSPESSNLYGIKLKKILQNSSGNSSHLNSGEKKNILELINNSKIVSNEFNFKISKKDIYFILKFKIKKDNKYPKIYYDLSSLNLNGGKDDDKIPINNYFVNKPWTWSMLLQPEIIGLYYNGVYLSKEDINNKIGEEIHTEYLPYFTWQLDNLSKKFNFTNSNKETKILSNLIDLVKAININDPDAFMKNINIDSDKDPISSFKNDINKITLIQKKGNKGESLLNLFNKIEDEKSFSLLTISHSIKNIINKLNSINNVNTKKIITAMITQKLIDQLDEINTKISAEEEVWLHIQSILSTQLLAKDYIKNNKLEYNSDPEFRGKLSKIKGLFSSLSCNKE